MSTTKPKRTAAQKRLDETLRVACAERANDPLPNGDVEERFKAWSYALRAVVADAVTDAGVDGRNVSHAWKICEWDFNSYDKRFYFHFDGHADLATSDDTSRDSHQPMFFSTRMMFDPKLDLDVELERLQAEAAFYREAVTLMVRETFRKHVRAANEAK